VANEWFCPRPLPPLIMNERPLDNFDVTFIVELHSAAICSMFLYLRMRPTQQLSKCDDCHISEGKMCESCTNHTCGPETFLPSCRHATLGSLLSHKIDAIKLRGNAELATLGFISLSSLFYFSCSLYTGILIIL